ncbi:unnamed protein product [Medioppia subpectinata]|uniref:TIL domain-containing protein n=1 Tax=Medioppia subpectinata TaxID=1979941 RepID=A0A7R9KUD4_9ACAR|nr:unnamed protein product [Medioppia subpectinata]CAG2110049.1 unnamed protein product [Medioppia subpectinata]
MDKESLFNLCYMNECFNTVTGKTCTKSNEEHNSCGSSCAKTCQNQNKQMMCASVCKDGCYCKKGYIRDEKSGQCVSPDKCPK